MTWRERGRRLGASFSLFGKKMIGSRLILRPRNPHPPSFAGDGSLSFQERCFRVALPHLSWIRRGNHPRDA